MNQSKQRASISAIIITKNEEQILPKCLASLDWFDEIIVVDSGSTDNTIVIAEQAGANVYVSTKWAGFGKQKQLAQHYATKEWILAIDADEVISESLKNSILEVLAAPPERTIFSLWRTTWVFGRFLKYSGWYDKIIRFYPRKFTGYNDAVVHEKIIEPKGSQKQILDGDMLHYPYRDLHQYLEKSAFYAKSWADVCHAQGKKSSIIQGIIHATSCFLKMYILKCGFLDGKEGFLIAVLSAHSTFVKYADLWIRKNDRLAN
ncbi:glycosyltransferase family 2 protein [Candidatus Enterovibrio altilux]|uniref:Lipopolysaccharide biosynthesis glycosyltransferase n=1 Tax=Candidatus Enterovibrio altilux TaxID=1927128 RepID=A0A291B8T1_9GAMM|nr:glycosyltransferase family 2 protein [Candidatus Enterovibrio luxaltus]ATF09377.1 Lipopolysaccharide biosynthesis glycosyltransferase [Candidatus Enterovibrio luxaltus]